MTFTALFTGVKTVWGLLSGGSVPRIAIGLALAVLFGLWRWNVMLYDRECTAHRQTRAEATAWRGHAAARMQEALAQQTALDACLNRETQAVAAAAERAAIMQKALPRVRAPEENRFHSTAAQGGFGTGKVRFAQRAKSVMVKAQAALRGGNHFHSTAAQGGFGTGKVRFAQRAKSVMVKAQAALRGGNHKVVDDETRAAAVARLNRSF